MKATVSEKGQVTIPKPLRNLLGIRKGHVLDFVEKAGTLVAKKSNEADAVDRVYGILAFGKSTDEIMTELRGKTKPV